MGVVYLASDPMLNRQVAMKTVDLSVETPEEREFLRERLLRDARAAAVLKHPNIVAIYDVFEDSGRAYLVMEYIEGESLAALLKNNPLPDASAVLKVLRQMADALDYTHARGVIHRDIKPANVMIDSTGTTKIMDFGIARITDARTNTPTGMVMGTVEYMAPEQILGEPVDGRADQFALAVVAYQMMTGSTLFGPNTMATLTYKLVHEPAPLPCSRNTSLPRGVDAVLAKALSKKPADRFSSCSEFAEALALAFSDAPTAPMAPATQVAAMRAQTTVAMQGEAAAAEPASPSRAPLVVAAIAVVLLGGALAAVIWKPWNHAPSKPAATTAAITPPATAPPTTEPPAVTPTPTEQAPESKTTPSAPAATTPAVHTPEPPKVTEPAKSTPVKSAPANPEPPKPGPAPGKVSTPATSAPTEPVAAPEPAEELSAASLPPEPKGGRNGTPYAQAMQRGQQLVKQLDYAGALRSFGDAVQLRPDSPQAHYSRGVIFQHFEQVDAAMRDYNDAIRLQPTMVTAYVGLGNCLAHQNRDPEALVEFQRALELNANAPMALFGRGNIYFRRKDYRAAIADYDKVLQINPRYAPAYQNRAHARQEIGDFAGAAADRRAEQLLRR
jgi:serine/threonine-protein kinase